MPCVHPFANSYLMKWLECFHQCYINDTSVLLHITVPCHRWKLIIWSNCGQRNWCLIKIRKKYPVAVMCHWWSPQLHVVRSQLCILRFLLRVHIPIQCVAWNYTLFHSPFFFKKKAGFLVGRIGERTEVLMCIYLCPFHEVYLARVLWGPT